MWTKDTRGRTTKNPGRKTVARHLVNSPKDSDIEERQRMQRKIHQAQEIQREMSLLERQNEELEINSREVEEALRDSDGSEWMVVGSVFREGPREVVIVLLREGDLGGGGSSFNFSHPPPLNITITTSPGPSLTFM